VHLGLELGQIDALVQNDHVCAGQALLARGLLGHDALYFLAAELAARHDPVNLGFGQAVDHTDFVYLRPPTLDAFNQQRDVIDQAIFALFNGRLGLLLKHQTDQGVKNAF